MQQPGSQQQNRIGMLPHGQTTYPRRNSVETDQPFPPTARIRVLLVDDHTVVRAGFRMLIEACPRIQVVAEAATCAEALEAAAREQPDIVVLDLHLGGESGLDVLPQLPTVAEDARVLLLTGVRDVEIHRQAIKLGAMGLVLKDQGPDILRKAIETVYAGEAWLDRATMANVLAELARGQQRTPRDPDAERIASLTPREREVITLIGEGLTNKQLAARLVISQNTVRHHLTAIFGKLGVADRLDLLIYALRHGLVQPPKK